jgi:hypothetical protein
MENPIVLVFHCNRCCDEDCQYPGDKSIGYSEDGKLAVWCEIHNTLISIWELKDPPKEFICDDCGRDIRDHKPKN